MAVSVMIGKLGQKHSDSEAKCADDFKFEY